MTNVYAVVGEHRANPERLLLLGEDGCFYCFTNSGRYAPVESIDDWTLDAGRQQPRRPTPENAWEAALAKEASGSKPRKPVPG